MAVLSGVARGRHFPVVCCAASCKSIIGSPFGAVIAQFCLGLVAGVDFHIFHSKYGIIWKEFNITLKDLLYM